MLPNISQLSSFDVYRDGGSLSASFVDHDGVERMLIFPVSLVSRESLKIECLGYLSPVLERHLQTKQASSITGKMEIVWKTQSESLSWEDARTLLEAMKSHLANFEAEHAYVYPNMIEIANSGGNCSQSV